MCRKGHMFAPLKVWRRWHRKINQNQKRHAVAAAIAATAVTPLVIARGHRVNDVAELPLVIDSLNVETTRTLLSTLKKFGVQDELRKIRRSRKIRSGKGKMRNSRYVMRKGPLIVYGDENGFVKRTARNLPGVDVCHVSRLNLLQLAPGGHIGRFVIWTKDAFKKLNSIFGHYRSGAVAKQGYQLNRSLLNCADLARIINSDSVQSKLRSVRKSVVLHNTNKKNPLKNKNIMKRLNPYDAKRRELDQAAQKKAHAEKAKKIKDKRKSKEGKKSKSARKERTKAILNGLQKSFADAEELIRKDEADNADEAPEEEE